MMRVRVASCDTLATTAGPLACAAEVLPSAECAATTSRLRAPLSQASLVATRRILPLEVFCVGGVKNEQ